MKISKKQVLVRMVAVIAIVASPTVYANQDSDLSEGPCNQILDACKSYAKTSKTKISLYRDCMQPLLNNEKISEIKIDPDVLKACQAKKAEIKQKK